jgi:hypothetical protein
MTLVKSLHSGDPDVPDVLPTGRYLADALQLLFGLHPLAVHVCSVHACSCNTCTGGSHVVSILRGSAIICRCSE